MELLTAMDSKIDRAKPMIQNELSTLVDNKLKDNTQSKKDSELFETKIDNQKSNNNELVTELIKAIKDLKVQMTVNIENKSDVRTQTLKRAMKLSSELVSV